MAVMQITVFPDSTNTALGDVIQEEQISVSGTSAQTSVVDGSNQIRTVRVLCDVDCYVTWGSNPTALTDGSEGRIMGANNPEYFSIKSGLRLAAITK